MQPIRLRYVTNVISRKAGVAQQNLTFSVLVDNLTYAKKVIVVWAGEDGDWRQLAAAYHYSAGNGREVWRAQAQVKMSAKQSLPGNVRFALCLRTGGAEYWDNNAGRDYQIDADVGTRMGPGLRILNVAHSPALEVGQRSLPLTVALDRSLRPRRIVVRWSDDGWRSYRETNCAFTRSHWDRTLLSNARNPNHYGVAIWNGRAQIDNAYRIEYAICSEGAGETVWDNNLGHNYVAHRDRLRVLTLNLHCYQEEEQDFKFSQIAQAINEHSIDIVCLQEVGEHWNGGRGDWFSNAARIIQERLHGYYYLHTDWSHVGFGRFREGVAILSRYPFLMQDAGYVSASRDPYNIHSRKVVMARVRVPYVGIINIFSVHLSWWEDGFAEQFANLRAWAGHAHNREVAATLLCGDFNVKAGSRGYLEVVATREFDDQYLHATNEELFRRVFRTANGGWQDALAPDYRIDYIFLKRGSRLRAVNAGVLFTEHDYGRVSDHPGYFAEFELV